MQIIADLHIHGPHSRGTSRSLTIQNLEKYARIKGLGMLGTGDFTHPLWLSEIKGNLVEDGSGVLKTGSGFSFILSAEVSNIYTEGEKARKIHNLILAPDLDTVAQINEFFSKHCNLNSDGRPTFYRMTCPELVENLISISRDVVIIPAHAWTPWFGIFGSKSGFDSVEECFKDQARHIFALETGLSSDPAMNWRLSGLDKYSLISNSDAHSYWPWRIGREANVFELENPSYGDLIKAIRDRDERKFLSTVEVDPSYGKYHLDGHRDCNTCLEPKESLKIGKICPVCRKPLTIGVLHRVEELADRPEGHVPSGAIPFKSIIPLTEIIGTVAGIEQLYSRKIWEIYERLIKAFGSEFDVLLHAEESEMAKVANDKIARLVTDIRKGDVTVEPGYDGLYGKLSLGGNETKKNKNPQSTLGSFLQS